MIDKTTIPKNWKVARFFELLDYRQPTNYIVKSTEYDDNYKTPVLTAGKSFIIGYTNEKEGIFNSLPVIIFDDFTTATQFVNFPFKVKSSAMKILHPKDEFINIKFVFYYMQTVRIKSETHKRYWISEYSKLPIPLPSFSEQQQIVSKIEELFSELDKGKQQLETVKQQLKTYRQAVLKWAFEGKFTSVNESAAGTSRDLSRSTDNLKSLPEGWKWVKTGDVIETIFNGYTPKGEFLTQNVGEIPFIKVYNLKFDGTLNFEKDPTFIPRSIHEKELKRSICHPNDVLINIVGPPLGKVSVVPKKYKEWNINQAIVLFRPNEKILSKYISYFLQNPATINWLEDTSKATAGQWNVKVSTCRIIPIPLPPIPDQEQIILEIETRLSVSDKMEETIENSLRQVESLRQSILKQAFEGKLV